MKKINVKKLIGSRKITDANIELLQTYNDIFNQILDSNFEAITLLNTDEINGSNNYRQIFVYPDLNLSIGRYSNLISEIKFLGIDGIKYVIQYDFDRDSIRYFKIQNNKLEKELLGNVLKALKFALNNKTDQFNTDKIQAILKTLKVTLTDQIGFNFDATAENKKSDDPNNRNATNKINNSNNYTTDQTTEQTTEATAETDQKAFAPMIINNVPVINTGATVVNWIPEPIEIIEPVLTADPITSDQLDELKADENNNLTVTLKKLHTIFDRFNEKLFNNELPQVTITLLPYKGCYGYMSNSDRWENENGNRTQELNICPDELNRSNDEIVGTLLHEMIHLYNDVHKIKDTSRQGRYHNKYYKEAAINHGLECEKTLSYGWCYTRIKPETLQLLEGIDYSFNVSRDKEKTKKRNRKKVYTYRCPKCGKTFKSSEKLHLVCECGKVIEVKNEFGIFEPTIENYQPFETLDLERLDKFLQDPGTHTFELQILLHHVQDEIDKRHKQQEKEKQEKEQILHINTNLYKEFEATK